MARNRFEDDDVMESETTIPEPPTGTPTEVAKRAWQVAWSASNAAAGYHASIINHLVAHEKRVTAELQRVLLELQQTRTNLANDFVSFRSTLLASLQAVGIRIDLSPSGDHSRVAIVESETGRERIASSHDLEEGLAEVGDRLEEQIDERLRDLKTPSDRVKELLAEERARMEAQQQIMRLDLEKKQIELAHAGEIKRLTDQRTELAEANARWLRVAFLIAGGVVTVLGALLVWALTRHAPSTG